MIILSLGVIDIPYQEGLLDNPKKATKRRIKKARIVKKSIGKTTGDIAEILEAKYGIMQFFANEHGDDIAKTIENSIAGAMENLLLGAPLSDNVLASAEGEIEKTFRHFLDMKEMDGKVEGVATEAALSGINHRLKTKKGAPRPSFIDTGEYQASFKAEFKT